jgi:D-lactate dehydrogenase (cytochrome)
MCGVVHHGVTSLQKIKFLNVEDMDVVVEPGVGWIELNEYLKPYGLFSPLDPGKVLVLCS